MELAKIVAVGALFYGLAIMTAEWLRMRDEEREIDDWQGGEWDSEDLRHG